MAGERREGSGTGGALGATFLGLLLVRSAVAEPAGEEQAAGQAAVLGARPSVVEPGAGDGGASTPLPADVVGGSAAGSVLTAGAIIDPVVLTRLGGEARFDEAALRMLRPEAAGAPPGLPAQAAQPAAITLALGDVQLPGAAEAAMPGGTGDDEDLGPIGEEIVGGDEDEVLVGGPDDDLIDGGGGDDTIHGGAGDDTLAGGAGHDVLEGEAGDDTLAGGAGDDALHGGAGTDALDGGAGDDLLDGGAGDDTMTGGYGDDSAVVGSPGDLVFEDPWGPGGGGEDTLVLAPDFGAQLAKAFPTLAKDAVATLMIGDAVLGGPPPGAPSFKQQVAPNVENVRLTGAEAHAVVGDGGPNVIEGNDAANLLWGGAGDDRIRGGAGDDRIWGGPGDDLLMGDAGDDVLDGGPGADAIYGGPGDDMVVLGLSDSAVDTIFDHEGANRLRIDGAELSRLDARLEGEDLRLAYDGRDLAVVVGHLRAEQALAGIEIDGRLHDLGEILRIVEPPSEDILAGLVDPRDPATAVPVDGGAGGPEGSAELAPTAGAALPDLFPGADLWVAETTLDGPGTAGDQVALVAPEEDRQGGQGGR